MSTSRKDRNGLVAATNRDAVYAVAFSPDGKRLAVGGRDGTLSEWPAEPALEPARYASVSGRVTSCCYAAGSGALAFSNTHDVFFWPAGAPQPSLRFTHPGVETVAIDPAGELIFSGDAGGSGKVWSVTKRAELASAALDVRGIVDSQWLTSKDEILVGTAAGEVILLQAADLTVRRRIVVSSKSHPVYRARLSPDGSTFAASYQVVRMGPIAAASGFTRTLHDYYEIAVWDSDHDGPDTGESLVGHFGWIGALAFSPDGKLLASGSADHGIKIWDPYKPRVLSENRAHGGTVHDLAFSPDGTRLVSASADRRVRLWNVPDLGTSPPTYWPWPVLEPSRKVERHKAVLDAVLGIKTQPPKIERLQAALDALLAIITPRETEAMLDGIAQVAELGPSALLLEDIVGLIAMLQIRQERAFREDDDITARRCSFILRCVNERIGSGLQHTLREAPAAVPPPVPPKDAEAAVSAILRAEADGTGSRSLERLIELAPPPVAFKAALSRMLGSQGDALPSRAEGTLACALLGYHFATATGNEELVAFAGNLLVGILGRAGRNTEGIKLAKELIERVEDPFHRINIESMLGNLYANSGRPLAGIAALEHAAQAIEKLGAAVGDERRAALQTNVYNNLAVIHSRLGDRLKQRRALDQAYASSASVGHRLPVLQNLGGYYMTAGDMGSAEQCFSEIINAKGVPPEHQAMAICDLARVHYLSGKLNRAKAEAQQALAAARKADAPGVEARALKCLAYIAGEKNKWKKAKAFAEKALDAARRAGDDGLVISAEAQLADAVLKGDPGSDLGYELLRSAGLKALAQRDALELLAQGEGFHRTVKKLAGRIIEQAMARGQVDDAWQACESARAHLLLKQLAARRQAKTNEMVDVGPPTLGAVRAALASLGPSAILIGYHIGEERSWLFVVRASEPVAVTPVDMTSSRLEKVYEDYDREIRGFQSFGDIGEQWLEQAAPLVSPLEQHLRLGDHLLVLPDGLLFAMPFHAMAIGARRIGQCWPVSYLPAASLLLSPTAPRGKPSSSAVLASLFTEEAEMVARILGSSLLVDGTKQDYLSAFSSAELIHVSMHGRFSDERPEMSGLVAGDPAPLGAFYAAAAKPPYARTGWETALFLARADELKKDLITATDLETVELKQGAAVVLSACESGLSLINEAADPVGLVRALLLSGAQTIVAAFWRVEPGKTAEMMQLFYEALSDNTEPLWDNPAEALRRAQVSLAAKNPHPFYWAPFYMIGGLRMGCARRPVEKTYAVDS